MKFPVSTSFCGKVPGKMIREEEEEGRQEGMKENSYKSNGEVVFSGGV